MNNDIQFERPLSGAGEVVRESAPRFRFLDGWFTQQFNAGVEPDYGYPKNHLSEPAVDSLEIDTVFFATKKA